MLIIFDVDGTLIGGEAQDWSCFDEAIEEVVGFTPTSAFFSSLPEITAHAIAQASVRAANREIGAGLEERIRDEYLRRLREAHARDPHVFPARDGIHALLLHLDSLPDVRVAIATGCWQATSSFKLAAAGIDAASYPRATSSDAFSRSEIIRLAAERAGRPLSEAVYVGDGIWDLKASRALGIRFIGTGLKLESLKEAGVKHTIEDFEPARFLDTVRTVLGEMILQDEAQEK